MNMRVCIRRICQFSKSFALLLLLLLFFVVVLNQLLCFIKRNCGTNNFQCCEKVIFEKLYKIYDT